jgi:hypothetical protein
MAKKNNEPADALSLGKADPLLKEVYAKDYKKPTYKQKRQFSKIRNAIKRKKKRSIPGM